MDNYQSSIINYQLNRDRCFNRRPRIVIHKFKILELEFEKVLDFGIEFHGRELARCAGQLLAGLLEVVGVQVRIAQSMDKFTRLVVTYLREHKREQRVRRDIEGHAEERVGTALVELATEFALAGLAYPAHVELEQAMARRQGHLVDFRDIPCAHQVAVTP